MAAKKKAKKKTPAKKTRTLKPTRKKSVKKKPAPKKSAKKKALRPKTAAFLSTASRVKRKSPEKQSRRPGRRAGAAFSDSRNRDASLGDADLQGLSDVEQADSESVDELLEEGNAFEAGVVEGVEEADDSDEREVRTHEVPEDDVPEEYLDRD